MRRHLDQVVLALALVALVALAARAASAQVRTPVDTGTRVRVQARTEHGWRISTGTLTAWEHDTIALRTARNEQLRVPLAQVMRLDVSRGKGVVGSHVLIGAGAGLVVGSVVGGVVGSRSCRDCWFEGLQVIGGAIVGGLIGTASGALVGVAIKGERWRRVPLEQRTLGLMPLRRGAAIGFSARF